MDPVRANFQQQAFSRDEEPGLIIQERFTEFLENFSTTNRQGEVVKPFHDQLESLQDNDKTTFFVDLEYVKEFDEEILYNKIKKEYHRFVSFVHKGAQAFAARHSKEGMEGDTGEPRDYWVSFFSNDEVVQRVRDMRTDKLGRLECISGTVTRTSEVRPELLLGTFTCLVCQTTNRDIVQQFSYTEPSVCINPQCGNRRSFLLNIEESKFVDWQRVHIQENSNEIPSGSMPRSMDVILRHEMVDRAKPGDKVVFTGTLIVVPDVRQMGKGGSRGGRQQDGFGVEGVTGLKILGMRDLSYRLAFLGCTVQAAGARDNVFDIRDSISSEVMLHQLTEEEKAKLDEMYKDPRLYQHMADSICPTVTGRTTIKKGVLLMLFGGVHKRTLENTGIRGDINVCIVGDPSTAKSQFLKYVADFLPRAVYTSGKASSAAGLTASVVRDQDSGEFCIEAGALMLADNGICCIDEFDKMDVKDQVAIHEAMEQQTISIAKAGIKATLNAATSILAACNPRGGRYDPSQPLRTNLNMSNAIMSRFDLFFIVTDECDQVEDYNIARHIVSYHQKKNEAIRPIYSKSDIQMYIKYARTINPMLTKDSEELLPQLYVKLREKSSGRNGALTERSYPIMVRQLESLIRLSEALARLHLNDKVRTEYVKQAYRLLDEAVVSLVHPDISIGLGDPEQAGLGDGDIVPEYAEEEPNNLGGKHQDNTLVISYDDYQQIASKLIQYVSEYEAEMEAKEDAEGDQTANDVGMRQRDLVELYLRNHEGEFSDLDDIVYRGNLLYKIIDRLTNQDRVFMEVEPPEGVAPQDNDDKYIIVHPNLRGTGLPLS